LFPKDDAVTAMLPEIPLVDLRGRALPHLAEEFPDLVDTIFAAANRRYTRGGIAVADALSRAWIRRNETPYAGDVAEIARRIGRPGVHMLNLSSNGSAPVPSPRTRPGAACGFCARSTGPCRRSGARWWPR
jgi:hypothetical protein